MPQIETFIPNYAFYEEISGIFLRRVLFFTFGILSMMMKINDEWIRIHSLVTYFNKSFTPRSRIKVAPHSLRIKFQKYD